MSQNWMKSKFDDTLQRVVGKAGRQTCTKSSDVERRPTVKVKVQTLFTITPSWRRHHTIIQSTITQLSFSITQFVSLLFLNLFSNQPIPVEGNLEDEYDADGDDDGVINDCLIAIQGTISGDAVTGTFTPSL